VALCGTKKEDIKKVISHPQALAQCDSYIKRLGCPGEQAYDTAGSAKLISEGKLQGVAAICSELAAGHYDGLEVLDRGIEDDSNNFTRFLLLRTDPIRIPQGVKCKTSIVFSLENVAGSLFKSLSVFALRDIDLSKIESRPCKPDVMDTLERAFLSMGGMGARQLQNKIRSPGDSDESPLKRRKDEFQGRAEYKYLFYVDFLESIESPNVSNAIRHLQEITTFFRVLGSYPRGGSMIGLENLGARVLSPSSKGPSRKRRIGILGFGTFGQFLAAKFVLDCDVFAASRDDYSDICQRLGVTWCGDIDTLLDQRLDVLIISTSILSFEAIVRRVSRCMEAKVAKGWSCDMLVVDVLSVKVHAKTTMLALLPAGCDILCTHPMFGPQSGKHGWNSLPFVYERVRTSNARRCEDHLKWWGDQGVRMVDMSCELHDECAAGSQFVTHFTGRALGRLGLRTTPINTKGFESLLTLVDNTTKDSFDLFYALYKCNPNSELQLQGIEEAIGKLSEELRAMTRQVSGAAGDSKS